MNKTKIFCLMLLLAAASGYMSLMAQEEEPIIYYQMEPFDDSLFIQIQNEVFIDPPDPKAEIIVDLRDPNNQTVGIKGTLYPFLAFTPETRARIQTYPFKLNLEESITYASVFTRVFEKMRIGKILGPPTLYQISPGLHYVNPFLQMFGGERFGIPLKSDVGLSFGLGTPYSGPLESNFLEVNFHILGFKAGAFSSLDGITELRETEIHNNLYAAGLGYQFSYVIPFGNFLEIGYLAPLDEPTDATIAKYQKGDTLQYQPKIITEGSFNWEFRYPFSFLGSTRAKFYVGQYLNEWHVGFTGREMSIAGSTFDFRFDGMVKSDIRQPQYVADILVQRIFESWAFSAFAIGPSAIFGTNSKGDFGLLSIFLNMRIKVGTSL